MSSHAHRAVGLVSAFIMASGALAGPALADRLVLKKAGFEDLPGWQDDRQGEALTAFSRSCGRILQSPAQKRFHSSGIGGKYGDWHKACAALADVDAADNAQVRDYFKAWFKPWRMTINGGKAKGKCTAYYEGGFKASRVKTDEYSVPVYGKPDTEGRWTRKQIMTGNWPHNDKAFMYMKDVFDLMALQTEGSARIQLTDGTTVRLEYAGKNNRPYRYIGEALVKRGIMKRKEMTSQRVRAWIEANPGKADEIIYSNQSYVYMRELPLEAGPLGSEGLVLTPERSIAIDDRKVPYSVPLWLDTRTSTRPDAEIIRRLVVPQDRGEGIKGAKRCDFFMGYGPRATDIGTRMTGPMDGWILLPKELTP